MSVCRAGVLMQRVTTDPNAPKPLRELASKDGPALVAKCQNVEQTVARTQVKNTTERARVLREKGMLWSAVLEWEALALMNARLLEPQRALCRLLPTIGRDGAAQSRCTAWKAIEVSRTRAESLSSSSSRIPTSVWIAGGIAGAAFVGAVATYLFASAAHTDLLDARDDAQAAIDEMDKSAYDSAVNDYESAETRLSTLKVASWALVGIGAVSSGLAIYAWSAADASESVRVTVTPNGAAFGFSW